MYFDLVLFTPFCKTNLLEHMGGTCAHIYVSRNHPIDGAQQAMSTESTQHSSLCSVHFLHNRVHGEHPRFFRGKPRRKWTTLRPKRITLMRFNSPQPVYVRTKHLLGSTSLVYIYAECNNLRDTKNIGKKTHAATQPHQISQPCARKLRRIQPAPCHMMNV